MTFLQHVKLFIVTKIYVRENVYAFVICYILKDINGQSAILKTLYGRGFKVLVIKPRSLSEESGSVVY